MSVDGEKSDNVLMSLGRTLAKSRLPEICPTLLQSIPEEDKTVIKNILLALQESVEVASVKNCQVVDSKKTYNIKVPFCGNVTLMQLLSVLNFNPGRISNLVIQIEPQPSLTLEICKRDTPISVAEIECWRMVKRAKKSWF